jgi:hypothetical protein
VHEDFAVGVKPALVGCFGVGLRVVCGDDGAVFLLDVSALAIRDDVSIGHGVSSFIGRRSARRPQLDGPEANAGARVVATQSRRCARVDVVMEGEGHRRSATSCVSPSRALLPGGRSGS